MILSGLGKQTCAVSDGGEGVHPPTPPPPIPRVHVGSSYRGRGYVGVGGNVWVGADGRTGGRAERSTARPLAGRPGGWRPGCRIHLKHLLYNAFLISNTRRYLFTYLHMNRSK